ncbi:MAG: RNA methyltransferase, partial [Calothrix sp. SM1_5_4]|nr:RNA methyltransferase [Calothrix sp. SM1_5_4]
MNEKLGEIPEDRLPQDLYLIFGPEADGLDSEDLAYVNFACHLPIYGDFGSLNLAQAVLLACFITRSRFPTGHTSRQLTGKEEPPARKFYFPDALIKEWTREHGVAIGPGGSSAYRRT